MARRATTVKPSEKSAINALSLKERVGKHPIHYFAYTVIAVALAVALAVAWLSAHYQVNPRDREIAYLKEQLSERDKTISKLEAAREPDRAQINQLLATNLFMKIEYEGIYFNFSYHNSDKVGVQHIIIILKF